jgi:hypothetical protein
VKSGEGCGANNYILQRADKKCGNADVTVNAIESSPIFKKRSKADYNKYNNPETRIGNTNNETSYGTYQNVCTY